MDTDVRVLVTRTGPRTIPGEQYSVMEASDSGGTYTGSLTISPLAEGQDDGQYTCSVTVSGGSSVSMATGSDSVAFDVTGKNYIRYYIVHTNKEEQSITFCMPCMVNTYWSSTTTA